MRREPPAPLSLWVDSATVFTSHDSVIGWAYLLVQDDHEVARGTGAVWPQTVAPLRAPGAALLATEQGLITCLARGHREVTLCFDDLALFY